MSARLPVTAACLHDENDAIVVVKASAPYEVRRPLSQSLLLRHNRSRQSGAEMGCDDDSFEKLYADGALGAAIDASSPCLITPSLLRQ